MTSKRGFTQKGDISPYKQKLQTNTPLYDDIDLPTKNLDLNCYKQQNFQSSNENDGSSCGRPDVLSIDSDFDSGNCLTESPEHDSSSPSSEKGLNFPGSMSGKARNALMQNPVSKKLQESYSYCTPPGHMASAISRVHIGKNVEQKKISCLKHGADDNFQHNVKRDPVSNDHNHLPQALYGRLPMNGEENGGSVHSDVQSSSSALATGAPDKNSLSVARNQKLCTVPGTTCKEAMDMRFTDLTHMQLKRSLDQIHSQGYFGSQENGYVSSGHYRDPTTKITGVQVIPTTFYNPISQPSKYDAILKVKDAMLQEKEAVILKLRLELSSLQHQVQESETALRQVIQAKTVPPNVLTIHSTSTSQNPASEIMLKKKIHGLEELLGKTEFQLSELQSTQFKERSSSEDRIKGLESMLKAKDQSSSEVKKKYKQNAERLEKYKKRVESLERYLGDLPTLEESQKLKSEAGMLGVEKESLLAEIETLKDKLQGKTKMLKDNEFLNEDLKSKEKTLKELIRTLEEKVLSLEKSKQELGHTERDEFEDLKFESNRLKKEQENATKMVTACDRRMKQQQERHAEEIALFQQKLNDAEEINENMRREQFLKQQTANKVHTAMMNLSSQNQQLMEQKLNLQEKVRKMEKSQSAYEGEAQAYRRLQRETHAAVQELKAVTQVLMQTADGADPNLSSLLGVRGDLPSLTDDGGGGKSPTKVNGGAEPADGEDALLSLEQTNKRVAEVRSLRRDLDQLRTMMTNRYAENIGENCTTQ